MLNVDAFPSNYGVFSHTWNGETQLKPTVSSGARGAINYGSHMKLRFARFGRHSPRKEGSVAVIKPQKE
eukprot:3030531-Prymnesium_polylepis.1